MFSFLDQLFFFPYQRQISFQDPATSLMEGILELHAFICGFLLLISVAVIWIIIQIIENFILVNMYFDQSIPFKIWNAKKYPNTLSSLVMLITGRPQYTRYLLPWGILMRKTVELLPQGTPPGTRFYEIKILKRYLIASSHLIIYTDFLVGFSLVFKQYLNRKYVLINDQTLEFWWTFIPCVFLLSIGIPSFYYLYIAEENIETLLSVKATGHQWYWTYDYLQLFSFWFAYKNEGELDMDNYIIETFMEPLEYLNTKLGLSRLLECDNYFLLPINVHLKLVISSADVLHSFAIPPLGLKVDAVPGRLNQLEAFIHRMGVFYGQCSEICGIGHGFMPICLYTVSYLNFLIGTVD